MKNFTPMQITALAVLTVIVVALAIFAFTTADNLAADPVDIPAAQATPEIVEIKLAGDTNTPTPVPIPMPTETPTATQAPSSTPAPTHSPKIDSGALFTLGIRNSAISVAYGVEEKTLERTPGWLTTSALPGQDGQCVVYGHRNRNHLKVLEDVARGDNITVTMDDGTFYTYIVSQITIFENTADLHLPVAEGKMLVLVTCYPFRYSGSAPGKYVVLATQI